MNLKKIINYELKEKTVVKIKSVKVLIYFFALMLIFTVLSRFSDSLTIPRVTVTKGVQGSIDSEITSEGAITQSKEEHITVLSELIIDSVSVSKGQSVKKGDVLLTLSLEDINEKIEAIEKEVGEINKATSRATEDYNVALSKENSNIKSAEEAVNSAKSALDNCKVEEEKILLKEDYEQKKTMYNELVNNKATNLLSYERAIEDSKNTEQKDKLSNKLTKLYEVKNTEGKVVSGRDGTITNVQVTSGSTTTSSVAISMADESEGNQFVAQVPKESKKKIAVGQDVILNSSSGNTSIDGLKIDSIKENEENKDLLDVSVKLPKGKGKIGEYASLVIPQSSKKYSLCVPLEVIHTENKENFVLVMSTQDTVLGTEEVARKVPVIIAEKNSKLAGIKEGSLSPWDEIISTSNKSIKDGDRVRKESE